MKRPLITFLLLCLSAMSGSAQDIIRTFEIAIGPRNIHPSLYNNIAFMDSREDSNAIGMVSVGLLKNRDARLVFKTPIAPQFSRLLDSLTDASAGHGTLLLQLRDFNFVEQMGTRYCHLEASLYARQGEKYSPLKTLDTTIVITVSDIPKVLRVEASKIFTDFLASELSADIHDTASYDRSQLENIIEIEKRQIPLYNTTHYVDGLYTSYASFSRQVPDRQGLAEVKRDGSLSTVKVPGENGKAVKVRSRDLYAVVQNGHLFIATEYGYYPLRRAGDNFMFTGDVRTAPSNGDMRGAQFATGLIGAAITSKGIERTYEMVLDHLNGNFIHLRLILADPQ